MRYEIILAPEAVQDLKQLRASVFAVVRGAIEEHLRHEPTKTSKSRIKRLRGLAQPQYRLRVGDVRVFYDVEDGEVRVLAVVAKEDTEAWLLRKGVPS
ncbi:MAG: type II toxin-antitoxin system RelE/ParE family toxin [Deltaproteobacteria bacterium]|nr:type II toxin-antitoxin system RelE/ParE family toxin [Deltaproteobacteria bacterium]